jgi:hypothetical protein
MCSLICYYSHFTIDPDLLSDDEFAKVWGRLFYALNKLGHVDK